MLSIEWGDVIALAGVLAPYLIAIGVIIVAAIVVYFAVRKMRRDRRALTRGIAGIAMVAGVGIVGNMMAFGPLGTLLDLASGSGAISDESEEEAASVAHDIAAEGFTLLQNDNDLLPLAEQSSVNLFGWASENPVYGGAGSGGLNDLFETVDIATSLEDAGFQVNNDLREFYRDYTADRPEMSIQKQSWTLPEPPADTYSRELIDGAKDFSDTAVVVLSRIAGEGHNDIPTDVSAAAYDDNSDEYEDFPEGEHYLQLSQSESDMIDLVTGNFDNVVLVLNSAYPLEMGFVDTHPEIQSVLWTPGPGHVGFSALGEMLSGTINPSGRATDTFVYDYTQAPWWNNQFKRPYENMSNLTVEGMNLGKPELFAPSFVDYVESIYVGYRYYETAATEGFIDYEETVKYPFGHGLSYTSFEQEMSDITRDGDELVFSATVTNTGDVAGKDVVEVFDEPPYTDGGIEKASANLVDFAKTEMLEPGADQTIEFRIPLEDLASFDESDGGAYVLESGDYVLSINADSHTRLDERTFSLDEEIRYSDESPRPSDQSAAVARLSDIEGDIEYLSRADGFANYDEATDVRDDLNLAEPLASEYHVNKNFDPDTYTDPDATMPTTGAETDLELADLRGADYDDPRWDELLDAVSVEEMAHLTSLAGYQTAAVDSIGKVQTNDADGPAAVNNSFTGVGSLGMPIEVTIASTWSKDLAERFGQVMGTMAREIGAAGWYAPGVNTHRVAFGSRNYEYFSEDGVLAGHMAAGATRGAASEGVYAYLKHFALYDLNGKMVSTWSTEQAAREIYLKPFEIAVKEGNARAMMAGWNYLGNKWVGEHDELLNDIVRGEWGFRGFIITDFFRNNGHGFMNADAALANGVDAMLSTFEGGPNNVTDTSNPSSVQDLRQATKNVLFTVVGSWMYDEDAPKQGAPAWHMIAYVIDGALVLLLAGWAWLTIRRSRSLAKAAA